MADVNNNLWDDSKVFGEGDELLPDGRHFKYQAWADCGYTFLTYTFPVTGLNKLSKEQLINYLISQGISINLDKFPLEGIEVLKSADQYQVTITIGVSEE